MKFGKRKWLILKVAFSIGILVYILRKVNISQILISLNNINFAIFSICFILMFVSLFLLTWRWKAFLNKFMSLKFIKTFNLFWASNFANLFGLGAVGGEVYKILLFKENKKKVLFSSLLDKAYSFLWYFLLPICLLTSFIFIRQKVLSFFVGFILYVMLSAVIIFIDASLKDFFYKRINYKLIKAILREGTISKKNLVIHWVFSTLFILNLVLIYYLIFSSLGFDNLFIPLSIFIPLFTIAITIPISFQGIGIRELMFTKFASLLSIAPEKTIAASFLGYLLMLTNGLTGIIPFILNRKEKNN